MATLTFDPLDYVKKLKAVGVPEEQAEVQVQALAGLLASDQLVTKQYLDMGLAELKTDLLKWFFGIAAGLKQPSLSPSSDSFDNSSDCRASPGLRQAYSSGSFSTRFQIPQGHTPAQNPQPMQRSGSTTSSKSGPFSFFEMAAWGHRVRQIPQSRQLPQDEH